MTSDGKQLRIGSLRNLILSFTISTIPLHLLLFTGHNAFNDMFVLSLSWGKVDGVPGLLAEWESLAMHTEGLVPCPRSRQVIVTPGRLVVVGVLNYY